LSTTVLQGSVATQVNCGKIFNNFFIANLLLSVMVKEFWRSVRIWQSYGKKLSGTFFFRTRCILTVFHTVTVLPGRTSSCMLGTKDILLVLVQ